MNKNALARHIDLLEQRLKEFSTLSQACCLVHIVLVIQALRYMIFLFIMINDCWKEQFWFGPASCLKKKKMVQWFKQHRAAPWISSLIMSLTLTLSADRTSSLCGHKQLEILSVWWKNANVISSSFADLTDFQSHSLFLNVHVVLQWFNWILIDFG